jgi:hypothetical protein
MEPKYGCANILLSKLTLFQKYIKKFGQMIEVEFIKIIGQGLVDFILPM